MDGNRLFSIFRVSARGLEAQRRALGAATENLANANTTQAEGEEPYAIKRAVHEGPENNGTRFTRLLSRARGQLSVRHAQHLDGSSLRRRHVVEDVGPMTEIEEFENVRLEFDPSHPHADENGYVQYPDVNVVEEMTRMISANRIYEANLTAIEAAKETIKRTLEI